MPIGVNRVNFAGRLFAAQSADEFALFSEFKVLPCRGDGDCFWKRALKLIFILAGMTFFAAACSVPEHMRVRSGVDPRNEDDNVRFRTIYYFRTFDACFEIAAPSDQGVAELVTGKPFYIKTKGKYTLLTDSLYRFRMTGKANDLFSSVHFEAGSLKASEIDPFGANVEFDDKNRRFHFVSREETEKRARRKRIYDEIRELDAMAARIGARKGAAATANQKMLEGVSTRMSALWGELGAVDGVSASSTIEPIKTVQCPKDTVARRGFQVLGPEGWRTFNQDERLVLAMSISGKPLIGAMKELSSRVLNEQKSPTVAFLKLARERLKITEAERVLERLDRESETVGQEPKEPEAMHRNVISAFSPAGG